MRKIRSDDPVGWRQGNGERKDMKKACESCRRLLKIGGVWAVEDSNF
jgi:hypothetical protein